MLVCGDSVGKCQGHPMLNLNLNVNRDSNF